MKLGPAYKISSLFSKISIDFKTFSALFSLNSSCKILLNFVVSVIIPSLVFLLNDSCFSLLIVDLVRSSTLKHPISEKSDGSYVKNCFVAFSVSVTITESSLKILSEWE